MEPGQNAFDADAYQAGLEPPSIILGGETYVGRILSYEEFLKYEARLRLAVSNKLTGVSFNMLILDYCDDVFGGPPVWKFWKPSIGRKILNLPTMAMLEAVKSFLDFQVRSMGMELEMESPLAEQDASTTEHQQET